MEDATEKQINFARSLGIEGSETFSKQALKELIDKKLKEREVAKPKNAAVSPVAQKSPIYVQESMHQVIITRTDKPHSFEWGKAGNRHKIFYGNIPELLEMMKQLKEAGLAEETNYDGD